MTQTHAQKRTRNRLQEQVLLRMESGLAPTHWQQLRLHLYTAWRQRRKPSFHRLAFHLGGVLRALWRPITLFRCAGIPVQFHLTCLIYPLGLVAFLDWHYFPARSALLVSMLAVLLGSGLLAHELAHALMARRTGVGARRIVFIPFGAVLDLESIPAARAELPIAAAGPLASLALAGGCWLTQAALEMIHASWTYLPRIFCTLGCSLNLMLGLFNLLPCFPMDGGRILRSLLAIAIEKAGRRNRQHAQLLATRIAVRYVGWLVATGMIIATITVTQVWLHLILFPLLMVVAEAEYWLLRTDEIPKPDVPKTVPNPCTPIAQP